MSRDTKVSLFKVTAVGLFEYPYTIHCLLIYNKVVKTRKAALKINSNMSQGESIENNLLLPFTDYCGHAPLLPGHYGCVEALLTWGADVDMDIPHLGTALYTACICQELECASKLLREGQFAAVSCFLILRWLSVSASAHKTNVLTDKPFLL